MLQYKSVCIASNTVAVQRPFILEECNESNCFISDDETEKNDLRHSKRGKKKVTWTICVEKNKSTKRKTKLGCACVSSAFLYVEGTEGFSVE